MSKLQAEKLGRTYFETLPTPRSRYLWIDQISINQEDLDERSAQIPLMNRIFASAVYVFGWLGDLDTLGLNGVIEILTRGRYWVSDNPHSTRVSYESMGNAHRELYVLTALLSRQWFRRAWVCQEAIFARRLYLWSGTFFLDWWILYSALQTVSEADLTKMSKFMGSLVRREPTTHLSKKLARMQPMTTEHELLAAAVSDTKIMNNLKAAVSFINGVVQIKQNLGLQCFDPGIVAQPSRSDHIYEEQLATLVTGLIIAPPDKPVTNGLHILDQTSKNSREPPVLVDMPLHLKGEHLSEPFTQAPRNPDQGSNNPWINNSFCNHNLKPLDLSPPVPVSLFSLITRFRDVEASDPRDKVFAFLHLATETPGLQPNYHASVKEVYMGATTLLLDDHNLTVLSYVQDHADTTVPDLPSWVPDFSVPLGQTPFVAHDGSSPYSASGSTIGPANFRLTAIDKKNNTFESILLFGYFLDTVAHLAEPKGCYFTRTANLALKTPKLYPKLPGTNYCRKSRLFLRLAEDPKTCRVEALWRTLIGDYCSNTYPAPVPTGFGFSDWVSVHSHHASHLAGMLDDHFAAVPREIANPGMLALEASQKRKIKAYTKLHVEDPGGYLCLDCTKELWEEKLLTMDKTYTKLLDELNLVPEMCPVRYMPDINRILALAKCTRTVAPHTRLPDPGDPISCPILNAPDHARMKAFENRMREVKTGRRMFSTKTGLMGMGPKSVQEGDEVWVALGARVPYVVRPVGKGFPERTYRLVGEAFVLGYMDGEVLKEKREMQGFGLI